MALTLASAAALLREHHLLREIIQGDMWTDDASRIGAADVPFAAITYDTRKVAEGTLLCCKGRFKAEYLDGIDAKGLQAYMAETDYSSVTRAPGLIVNDSRKAMSLLSAEFYGRPQDELTLIGITGTKGKTTTAYFTQAMLGAISGGRAALFSSVDNCLNGRTYVESDLTTPESMDAFRMMREAVDNGMRYLVMEVSSQAYKVDRVYGLDFDAAAFLNISPDHISPIEHPTFEDYLYCKRQLIAHTKSLVLGADCAHADLLREDAALAGVPVVTFATDQSVSEVATADFLATANPEAPSRYVFSKRGTALGACGLTMEGEFNAANAAAAIALIDSVGGTVGEPAFEALAQVRISGRMEHFEAGNIVAYVDYAHNYVSSKTLSEFVLDKYRGRNPRIVVVTGSVGDKAIDRREGIIRGVEPYADRIILTSEDTVKERMIDILHEMQGYVTNPQVSTSIELDRAKAIEEAVADARAHADRLTVLLIIGKGEEQWIKVDGRHAPYEGDGHVIRRLLGIGEPASR